MNGVVIWKTVSLGTRSGRVSDHDGSFYCSAWNRPYSRFSKRLVILEIYKPAFAYGTVFRLFLNRSRFALFRAFISNADSRYRGDEKFPGRR